ncbi:VC0807 family protein [Streptantibioticus parmotrematis]|uniref:VC0807 family protein n=1 Tax=Streptantibioticus parmotrematis TaxID=2873249 RepID=UPI00207BDCA0|nr:VC0807 family protein [Streptantibioticus parmotrematis]
MSESPTKATTQADATSEGVAGNELVNNLKPLVLDIAIPLGSYYALHDGFGVGLVMSLALSSVVPAARTVFSLIKDRRVNGLAALMLAVNVIGIALSFVTGNPRIMLAKDSGVSSVIGIAILVSAFGSKPLMSAGLKPMITKGQATKVAVWDHLAATSTRFQRLERLFSVIWGGSLLVECVARLIGAFTLPVSTMVWLGTVLTIVAIGAAIVIGQVAADPMEKMVEAEADAVAKREAAGADNVRLPKAA